jgi:hypothetical protein
MKGGLFLSSYFAYQDFSIATKLRQFGEEPVTPAHYA